MRAPKRTFLFGAGGIAVAACLVFLLVHHRDQPVAAGIPAVANVSVLPVQRQAIAHTLSLAGVFQPFQEVDVHGKVSGYIRRINVDIGDRVRQGQVLATLEVPELQAQVLGADAGVQRSRSDIDRLQNEVSRAQASYSASHANYKRLKDASDQRPGLIAAQELDDAQARDLAAAAQVDAARSAVSAGQQQLGMSRADLQRVHTMAQYATIVAPFTGVVTARYADTGSLIPAGTANNTTAQAVVRLAQSDVLRLRMPVPEEDVSFVHVGSAVRVHVQATGQTFTGQVIRFSRDVSDATRTMQTEVDVPNPGLELTPGMYADVTFDLQQKPDAIVVPAAAVVQGDQPVVWVVDGSGHARRREVRLGIAGANTQEILAGVQPGEQVIVGGQSQLQAGEAVHAEPAHLNLVDYRDAPQGGR